MSDNMSYDDEVIVSRPEEDTELELDIIEGLLNKIRAIIQLDGTMSTQERLDDMEAWFENYQGKND